MNTFACPEFSSLDDELVEDFNGCVRDNINDIHQCIGVLESDPCTDNVHPLFQHMHSLKGNCRMVNLDQASDIMHALEDIVTDIRADKFGYTTDIGDLIIAGIAQIEQLITAMRQFGSASADHLEWLLALINSVHACDDGSRASQVERALLELGSAGFGPSLSAPQVKLVATAGRSELQFFTEMAHHIDQLSIYWKGRTQTTTKLAFALNKLLGNVADPKQLEAAVCVHDMGMALIPHTIFNKQGDLSREEHKIVNQHVHTGADMLSYIPDWEEASLYVRQHHERFDGSGYPQGLKGDEISPGARIISIVDTFFAVTNERPDRSYRRSILSAISEINGNVGTQFDPAYIESFNQVVREQFIAKKD